MKMRLEKKTTATLLIAIFMISTLAIAPIMAQTGSYHSQVGGKGLVYWAEDGYEAGGGMIRLELPADAQYDDEARVVFEYGENLDSLDSVFYWGLIEARNEAGGDGDFEPTPYVTFSIDYDDDTSADAWGVAWVPWEGIWPADFDWHSETFDDGDLVAVSASPTGQGEEWPTPQPGITLAELKALDYSETVKWGDLTVLEVKVGIGNWGPYTPPSTEMIAYVDDVIINTVHYDFDTNDAGFPIFGDVFTDYLITVTISGSGSITPTLPNGDTLEVIDEVVTIPVNQPVDFIVTPDPYMIMYSLKWDNVDPILDSPKGYVYHFSADPNEYTLPDYTIHSTFLAGSVSISVTPESWDFGPLPVGGTAITNIFVENTGDFDVSVHANIVEPFFQEGLKLDGIAYNLGWNLGLIPELESIEVGLMLTVPDYPAGTYADTLVFEITPPKP